MATYEGREYVDSATWHAIPIVAALAAIIETIVSPAHATKAMYGMAEPKWRPVPGSESQRLNLYAEFLRNKGVTDEFEKERLADCGPQKALQWADFLGIAETAPDGAGGCLRVVRESLNIDADKFQKAYNDGLSVSKSILRSGKGSAKLLNLHNGSSAGQAAVTGPHDVEQLTIASAAKLQGNLEAAAVKLAKSNGNGGKSVAWPKLIAYFSAGAPPNIPGYSKEQLGVMGFLRSKGVSVKEAAAIATKWEPIIEKPQPVVATESEKDGSGKSREWFLARARRLRAIAKAKADSADRLKIAAVAVGIAATVGIVALVKR